MRSGGRTVTALVHHRNYRSQVERDRQFHETRPRDSGPCEQSWGSRGDVAKMQQTIDVRPRAVSGIAMLQMPAVGEHTEAHRHQQCHKPRET